MVTVKDLVQKLQTMDQDMPVFWGVDELPCWIVKKDKTIEDFPMRVEVYLDKQTGEYIPTNYLYFSDYDDIRRALDGFVSSEIGEIPRIVRRFFNWRRR